MSITFLVLKWLSQVLIVSSGIYGMFSDLYREDKQTKRRALTRAGYFNLSALLSGFILFGVTDYKERQDQREQRQKGEIAAKVTEEHFKVQAEGQNSVIENQKKQIQSQDDELRYLHHLILVQEIIDGWEISLDLSPGVIETARRQAESLKAKEDAYLRACLEFASIDARKSANEHWAIT